MIPGPAYRIETARISLRCLEPRHLTLVARAVEESLAHLRPWMAWARHEPASEEHRLERLRTNRGHFDLGSDFTYGLFDREGTTLFGIAALKLGQIVDERELGYWLHPAHTRQGLMHEAGLALLRVGFELEPLDGIDLRVDPDNVRSAQVAVRLGFEGPVIDPLSAPGVDGDKRDTHVYSLSRVAYAGGPAPHAPIEAYDVLERRIF
ncbi:MAG: GNAT family protein [Polyangiales bacterium]